MLKRREGSSKVMMPDVKMSLKFRSLMVKKFSTSAFTNEKRIFPKVQFTSIIIQKYATECFSLRGADVLQSQYDSSLSSSYFGL